MLTIIEAQHIAKQFAKKHGEIVQGIYFDVGEGETFSVFYYFDYQIIDENGKTPNPPSFLCGAPGVTVNKHTGEIKEISFGELAKLEAE